MLKKIVLSNFTAFESATLEFSRGVNVFVGANATGKTHVMKLAYSITRAWRDLEKQGYPAARKSNAVLGDRLATKLTSVFRPNDGKVGRLVRRSRGRKKSTIELGLDGRSIEFSLSTLGNIDAKHTGTTEIPDSILLPAREVLSIYPGFIAAYQNRELAFDETYYDLCLALSASPLRGPRGETASALWRPLGDHMHATVSFEEDRFYLVTRDDGIIEVHLAAEGYRKIATLMHLIANGSLMKNAILFWDEPEANLNPRLTKIVSDFLLRLASSGIQVFVASHDYLLTNELSLNAEYATEAANSAPIRFFAFGRRADGSVEVQSGATLAELSQNPIMEEFEALYERERGLFYGSERSGKEQPIA
jgi:AAA domain, putative AbiEii toxin, Type IV TA system/AAA domain